MHIPLISSTFRNLTHEEKKLLYWQTMGMFLSALLQMATVKEFTSFIFELRLSAYIFFAVSHIFFGVGAYAGFALFQKSKVIVPIKRILILIGVIAPCSLLLILKCAPHLPWLLLVAILSICATTALFGMIYGLILSYFRNTHTTKFVLVIAASTVSFILGFVADPLLTMHIGVNATYVLIGLLAVLIPYVDVPRRYILLGILLTLTARITMLDHHLESLRYTHIHWKIGDEYQCEDTAPSDDYKNDYLEVFNGWSPYSKVNILVKKDGSRIAGLHNYNSFWAWYPDEKWPVRGVFGFIKTSDSVLYIGAASGRDINRFPPGRKTTRQNTILVEIDPAIVTFFRSHPAYNNYLFYRARVITADGRNVLDEMKEKKDIIILGLTFPVSNNIWMFHKHKTTIFTRESLKRCFDILNKDGILIVRQTHRKYNEAICSVLDSLNIPYRNVQYGTPQEKLPPSQDRIFYYIYASRNTEKLDRIAANLPPVMQEVVSRKKRKVLTDDQPFIPFLSTREKASILHRLTVYVCFSIGLCIIIISAARRTFAEKLLLLPFPLIGTGYFLTHLFIIAQFRSFYHHPLATIIVTSSIYFLAGTIGNLLSQRISPERLRSRFWIHLGITAGILIYFKIATTLIPFSVSSYPLKLAVGLIIVAPMGLLTGFFFPITILTNPARNMGLGLLLDGIGTCTAILIFYCCIALWGISANFFIIAICYLSVVMLLSRVNKKTLI